MSGHLRDLVRALGTALATAETAPAATLDAFVSADEFPAVVGELLTAVNAYTDRHAAIDGKDSQRLQDELVAVHRTRVEANTARELIFLKTLVLLQPCLISNAHLGHWAHMLMAPALDTSGRLKVAVDLARQFLVGLMVFDTYGNTDSRDPADCEALAAETATDILGVYLQKTLDKAINVELGENPGTFSDERLMLINRNAEAMLIAFGQRRPKAFFAVLDTYFVQPEYRIRVLNLLCSYVQTQPPHLFETHSSQLVEHLYTCLLHDTSAVAMNLATTVLAMLLPCFCTILGDSLPQLFAIFARVLYWDIIYDRRAKPLEETYHLQAEREADDDGDVSPHAGAYTAGYNYYDDIDGRQAATPEPARPGAKTWDPIGSSVESAMDSSSGSVHAARLFTFIYGIYPIHFLVFLTNPYEYARRRSVSLRDYLNFDIADIKLRVKDLCDRHILHPNLFRYTYETELTDPQRWERFTGPEEIAAFCITLDTYNLEEPSMKEPGALFRNVDLGNGPQRAPRAHDIDGAHHFASFELGEDRKAPHTRTDVPGILGDDPVYDRRADSEDGRSMSEISSIEFDGVSSPLLNDRASAFPGPAGRPTRSMSVSNMAAVRGHASLAAAVSPGSGAHTDGSQALAGLLRSNADDIETILEYNKMLNGRSVSRRGSLEMPGHETSPTPATGSGVASAAGSGSASGTASAALSAAPSAAASAAPSAAATATATPHDGRPSTLSRTSTLSYSSVNNAAADTSAHVLPPVSTVALQRQILMLTNELNFERYLKQLRLRNIKKLKNDLSMLARDDANLEGLFLSNHMLVKKVNRLQTDSKRSADQMASLTAQRTKYSDQLVQRNRELKDERDKWKAEEEAVRAEIKFLRTEVEILQRGVIDKETEIEQLARTLKEAENKLKEAELLQERYDVLEQRLSSMKIEADPSVPVVSQDVRQRESLELQVARMQMQLDASELDKFNAVAAYEQRIRGLEQTVAKLEAARLRRGA
ncbi:Hamartin protein-domain-containing protein [Dipodascopsis tothii]|uniref:Hamartin protein-domain-containing protein n=1 Tax=Dipodascopsis tothii TaxID=44089 RepID=UPI0034CD2324